MKVTKQDMFDDWNFFLKRELKMDLNQELEYKITKQDVLDDWIFFLIKMDIDKKIQAAGVIFGGFVMADTKGGIGKALELVDTFKMNKAGKSFRKGVESIITNEKVLKIREKKLKRRTE